MSACCGRVRPEHARLLDRLADLVPQLDMTKSQIWQRRGGWAWQCVDLQGVDTVPLVASTARLADCLAAVSLVAVPNDTGTVVTIEVGV